MGVAGVREPEQPGGAAAAGGKEARADGVAGQRLGGALGAGEHDRDAGAGGDAGRLDLGDHAAGADRRRAGPGDVDAGEVGLAA